MPNAANDKDYRNTVEALTTSTKKTTLSTKLGKIAAHTEDDMLKEACEQLRETLHRGTGQQIDTAADKLKAACERIIASKKPQWQILAERAGWTPPQAKKTRD